MIHHRTVAPVVKVLGHLCKEYGPYVLEGGGVIYDLVERRVRISTGKSESPVRCPPCLQCGGHRRPDEAI